MIGAESRADSLLSLLRKGPCHFARIERDLSLSRNAAAEVVAELENRGYAINTTQDGTLSLVESDDLLSPDDIEAAIAGFSLGRPLHTYGRVGSTNTAAAELAESGAPEGTLVTAEEQTRGRGRQGRTWHSPPGLGIWMSLVLRPTCAPADAAALPLVAGLAIAAAIREVANVTTQVKWPNDVLIDGKKVAGVLCESAIEGQAIRYSIMGIGINVNHLETELPQSIRAAATSVRIASGRKQPRVGLMAATLRALEARLELFHAHGFAALRPEFQTVSCLSGKRLRIAQGKKSLEGVFVDVAPDGALMIDSQNRIIRIQAGEASLRME